jgi:hypothetical protein
MRFPYILFTSSLLVACAPKEYVYQPVSNLQADVVAGRPAADYAVPGAAPRGTARIASFGFADIKPAGASDESALRALHLRMIVANDSDQTWRVDTRAQGLILANDGESRAAYATADGTGTPPPIVTVAPKAKRTIDLFFPLPSTMQQAEQLPAFDAVWSVQTDKEIVTRRTAFERLVIEPRAYEVTGGASSPYWYDPLYPSATFYGVVTLPPPYVHRPVVIERVKLKPQ